LNLQPTAPTSIPRRPSPSDRYKWIALSNTTLAVLLATLDASITLIAMPDIFRGIHLDPLVPANSFYLLWMILGYLVVSSVLIVSLGRLGDMFGRVRIYNLGFVIYTVASLLLTIDWMTGRAGADYLIVFRIVQGVGGACLLANAAAIITDAFPVNQRGMALGINNIVGVSGMFVGLVLGGLLAPIDWRLVFLISVPVGLFGTVWGYLKLEERSSPKRASIDWWGERHVRARVGAGYGGCHLRDTPLRWPRDRVELSTRARPAGRVDRLIGRVRRGRAEGCRADVPPHAVSHPRVHVRHALHVPRGDRARGIDVHAHHLAPGDLAARARLLLH
jgi:MFS family permease